MSRQRIRVMKLRRKLCSVVACAVYAVGYALMWTAQAIDDSAERLP